MQRRSISPIIALRARQHRSNLTPTEATLWAHLRGHRLDEHRDTASRVLSPDDGVKASGTWRLEFSCATAPSRHENPPRIGNLSMSILVSSLGWAACLPLTFLGWRKHRSAAQEE
ncbi:MAG: hypothetical protein ABI895_28330 [Deltaproteobacteria bacterium]